MFTTEQKDIIATGRYSIYLFYDFELPSGTIKWTTMPYDYGGYESENFILGNGNMTTKQNMAGVSSSLEIAGNISMLAAFDGCRNSKVTIKIGIRNDGDVFISDLFIGMIDKYEINRQGNDVKLLLDLTDTTSSTGNKNARLLTMDAQLKYSGDQCLKNMVSSEQAVFWGKEV